jgi:hypothetical protein
LHRSRVSYPKDYYRGLQRLIDAEQAWCQAVRQEIAQVVAANLITSQFKAAYNVSKKKLSPSAGAPCTPCPIVKQAF